MIKSPEYDCELPFKNQNVVKFELRKRYYLGDGTLVDTPGTHARTIFQLIVIVKNWEKETIGTVRIFLSLKVCVCLWCVAERGCYTAQATWWRPCLKVIFAVVIPRCVGVLKALHTSHPVVSLQLISSMSRAPTSIRRWPVTTLRLEQQLSAAIVITRLLLVL